MNMPTKSTETQGMAHTQMQPLWPVLWPVISLQKNMNELTQERSRIHASIVKSALADH